MSAHPGFAVIGLDRGARVAYRMALDNSWSRRARRPRRRRCSAATWPDVEFPAAVDPTCS
jgi:hypothetical protein